MTTKNDKDGTNLKAYSPPRLLVYGSVSQLTASGTQGGTEDPTNANPDPRNKP